MASDNGQSDLAEAPGYRVAWFAPDRPVAGTVFIRPDSDALSTDQAHEGSADA